MYIYQDITYSGGIGSCSVQSTHNDRDRDQYARAIDIPYTDEELESLNTSKKEVGTLYITIV